MTHIVVELRTTDSGVQSEVTYNSVQLVTTDNVGQFVTKTTDNPTNFHIDLNTIQIQSIEEINQIISQKNVNPVRTLT